MKKKTEANKIFDWLEQCDGDCRIRLPRGVDFVHQYIPELRKTPLNTDADRIYFHFLWRSAFAKRYPDIYWEIDFNDLLITVDSLDIETLGSTASRLLALRDPLAIALLISSDSKDGIIQRLVKPISGIPSSVPRFLYDIWLVRSDLKLSFNLQTDEGAAQFIEWWCAGGALEYSFINYDPDAPMSCRFSGLENIAQLLFKAASLEDFDSIVHIFDTEIDSKILQTRLKRYEVSIIRERPDLIEAASASDFDLPAFFRLWWFQYGVDEYRFLNWLLSVDSASCGIRDLGVNIVGFPFGTLGLGEDARQMSSCLGASIIPNILIDAPVSGPERTVEIGLSARVSREPKFDVSVFCLPPTDMIRLALEGGRDLIAQGKYNIGAWPWELPEWPSHFSGVVDFVDEIWAQSEYVANCFRRLGDKEVVRMPMAVTLPPVRGCRRSKFGLPEDDFIFYFTFDGNSWLSRKNPIAAVQAFKKAFPLNTPYEGVFLLIKAMNVRESDPQWQEIISVISGDKRIILNIERLSRQDMVDLMSLADCYISLHRSEGFGRGIAEAMLLGQPVVVSGYSGNLDYCSSETSFLVNGEVINISPGSYIFDEHQYWFDPDVGHAACQLRAVFENTDMREAVASAGQRFVADNYSISAVATAYRNRLRVVFGKV